MIQSHSEYNFNGLKAEVNYNKESKPCKTIKFTIGKESAEIPKEDLYALLQLYADDKEMEATLTTRKMRPINRMMTITSKEAIKAGGTLKFMMPQMVTAEQADEWDRVNKDKSISLKKAEKMVKQMTKDAKKTN